MDYKGSFEDNYLEDLKKKHPDKYRKIMESREREAEDTSASAWNIHMNFEEQDSVGKRKFEKSLNQREEPEGDGWLRMKWK